MAYIPSSGSVVAFQGTDPWIITGSVQAAITPAANQSVSGTVQTDVRGSVATVIIGGSIVASFTPPANQSVSGTVGASVIGHAPVVIVGGSILTSSTPNQSVSGTVNVGNFPANQSVSGTVNVGGSVVAFEGAGWSGSVASYPKGTIVTSLVSTVPSSVIVGASIFGLAPVNVTNTNINVSGSVIAFPTGNQSVSGTVTASVTGNVIIVDPTGAEMDLFKQGDNFAVGSDHGLMILGLTDGTPQKYQPLRVTSVVTDGAPNEMVRLATTANLKAYNGTTWDMVRTGSTTGALLASQADRVVSSIVGNPSISGTVDANLNSTNASVISVIKGSVATVIIGGSILTSSTPNQSVSGTVQTDVRGSVATVIIGGSIAASFTPPANQSVSGTVGASVIGTVPVTQGGTWIASVFGNMSVLGTVPVTQSGAWTTSVVGTVATTQSGTWISSVVNIVPSSMLVGASIIGLTPVSGTVTANQGTGFGSIAAHIKSGSVVAVLGGNTSVVVAGGSVVTYGARNDALASFLGADLAYRPQAEDSAGRLLVKPFTSEDNTIISYVGSLVSASVTLIQSSVTGKKAYVTDMWLSNSGATTAVVTIKDGASNNMGQFIVPAGGGSNSPGIAIPLKTAAAADLLWQPTASSSILYLTLKGYVAP